MAMIDRPVKINGTKYSIKDIEILTGWRIRYEWSDANKAFKKRRLLNIKKLSQ